MSKIIHRWAVYDTSNYPDVKVKLRRNIENNEQFELFLQDWLNLYNKKQNFTLDFDATEVGFVSIRYAYKMSNFIKKLKNDYDVQYLKESNITVSSFYIKSLLNFIFFLQEPVCPIYIKKKQKTNKILNKNGPEQ